MALLAIFLPICIFANCSKSTDPNSVVVYTAHDLIFSEPILKDFEAQTGIKVLILGDTEAAKTVGLVNKLIKLKDKPEADIFWNNEIIRTIVLKKKGILKQSSPADADDIPPQYRDKDGTWYGFAARARVLLYNTNLVSKNDAPQSIFGLTDKKWKGKVVIANPLFGSTATHLAALFHVMGKEKAKQYLVDLKANEVRIVAGNAMARNLVMNGEFPICLTDTDDANGAFLEGKPVEMVYPDQDSIGTLIFPNTVMIINGAPHQENAKKMLNFLLSKGVEERLASSKAAQIPLRKGIKPYSDKFDLKTIKAMKVDWEKVADLLEESNKFINEVFLK